MTRRIILPSAILTRQILNKTWRTQTFLPLGLATTPRCVYGRCFHRPTQIGIVSTQHPTIKCRKRLIRRWEAAVLSPFPEFSTSSLLLIQAKLKRWVHHLFYGLKADFICSGRITIRMQKIYRHQSGSASPSIWRMITRPTVWCVSQTVLKEWLRKRGRTGR